MIDNDPTAQLLQVKLQQLPAYVLGVAAMAIPPLLFVFKRNEQLLYGAIEIIFCAILGFLAAQSITVNKDNNATAFIAFFSAMYVGARGWQNVVEAWEAKKQKP